MPSARTETPAGAYLKAGRSMSRRNGRPVPDLTASKAKCWYYSRLTTPKDPVMIITITITITICCCLDKIAEDLYQIFARPVNGLQVVSMDKSEVQADGKVMITFEYLLSTRSVGIIVEEFVNKAIAAVQGQDTTNRYCLQLK